MPDPFLTALGFVHESLRDLHTRGVRLRASADSLLRLSALTVPLGNTGPEDAVEESTPATLRVIHDAPEPEVQSLPAREILPLIPSPSTEVITSLPLAVAESHGTKIEQLDALRGPALVCTRCPHLVQSRTQVVFGVGNPDAEIMFVGEAPGEDEDRQGEPFVGRAGQLLTKIIETMGYRRDEVYIANVLKCRPDMPAGASGNRKPTPAEMRTCLPYLEQQIAIIRPKALIALGATAMEGLLGETMPMARLRGRWHEFRGIPLMATYHPAYLLRNQSLTEKRKVWEDMLLVLERLGKPISEKQRSYFMAKS